ncbi:MAG: PQQ-binding-like beta-propeller repeat protein [Pirellulales bacterium]
MSADWTQFRGPDGQGHSSESGLPLTWSETENVVWRTPIAGLGWSSVAIQGDQIWLTTATDEGESLRAVCLDRQSGQIVHDVEALHLDDPGPIHSKNSHASPTPILEKDRVYVHFGAHGSACLNTSGEVLWRNTELKYNHQHGPGGSPVIHDDLMIVICDGADVQFVVAFDKNTGEVRWKTDRQGPMAYCTPLIIQVDGQDQVFCPGGEMAAAYNPRTGEELWRVKHPGYSVVPRPVAGHGLVFFSSSYNTPVLFAVRVNGSGDVTDSHIAWKLERGAPHNPSPLLVGDELYIVSDKGIAQCLDAKTGDQHWLHRLGGEFSASPLLADGRIYFLNEAGETTVIKPGKTYEELAINQVDGRTLASLSTAGKSIFLRTNQALYRIENK